MLLSGACAFGRSVAKTARFQYACRICMGRSGYPRCSHRMQRGDDMVYVYRYATPAEQSEETTSGAQMGDGGRGAGPGGGHRLAVPLPGRRPEHLGVTEPDHALETAAKLGR